MARHFLSILQGRVTCSTPFAQSLLRNYIVRGFDNMIQILHSKYIQFLSEHGLSKDFLAYVVKGAAASSSPASDSSTAAGLQSSIVKTTIVQS